MGDAAVDLSSTIIGLMIVPQSSTATYRTISVDPGLRVDLDDADVRPPAR